MARARRDLRRSENDRFARIARAVLPDAGDAPPQRSRNSFRTAATLVVAAAALAAPSHASTSPQPTESERHTRRATRMTYAPCSADASSLPPLFAPDGNAHLIDRPAAASCCLSPPQQDQQSSLKLKSSRGAPSRLPRRAEKRIWEQRLPQALSGARSVAHRERARRAGLPRGCLTQGHCATPPTRSRGALRASETSSVS